MPLGTPVVPDENRMKSGCAKGRRSKRGAGPPLARQPREVARAVERRAAQEADPDHVLDGRQAGADLRDPLGERVRLAAVPVAVGGEQDLGLDLAEAVEHAAHAEVGRARGPDRAERGRREHRDDGLGAVRQDARDPIARAHADAAQPRGERADLRAQLRERQLAARAVLAGEDQRGRGVVAAQQVLGVVEPRSGEEARAGHAVVQQIGRVAGLADHLARSSRPRARTRRAPPPTTATGRRSQAGAARSRARRACGTP